MYAALSRLHGSASCCNGHSSFDGKQAFLGNVNKKRWNRLSPKFAQVITLVPSMYVENLVAICGRGLLGTYVKYYTFCPFLTHHLSHPFYFLRTSTGRTPEPILMVDGSNDASWLKEVPYGYANNEKIHSGGLRPQKLPPFRPSREITAKTWTINNFETACFSHLLLMYHL